MSNINVCKKNVTTTATSPRITLTCSDVFIHWLAVKFTCVDEHDFINSFFRVTKLKRKIENANAKVLADYRCSNGVALTHGRSLLLSLGGNCFMLIITGSDCEKITNWNDIHSLINSLNDAEIKRIDIAVDVTKSNSLKLIIKAHSAGQFTVRGKTPTILPIGNFTKDDGRARTVLIGKRTNGKMLRAYEIGRKNNTETRLEVRLELELKGKSGNIPLEVIKDPLPYFSGGYPYLAQFGNGEVKNKGSRIKSQDSSYSGLIDYCRSSYGKLISLMGDVEASPESVIKLITRHGYPDSISPEEIESLLDAKSSRNLVNRGSEVNKKSDVKFLSIIDKKVSNDPSSLIRGVYTQARTIKLKLAAQYLGVTEKLFAENFRKNLTPIPIGRNAIGFDRYKLDLLMDQYIDRYSKSNH